jgi:hypothetical protein
VVKKFTLFDCTQETIPLMDFLETLESATNFDPKKSKATKGENLLWDYKKSTQNERLTDLLREDVHLLKRQIWAGMEMPKRFIPENAWIHYQEIFEQSPHKPFWNLSPIFVPHPGKKISTWMHHYFKIKQLVAKSLKKGYEPIFSTNKTKASLKNFGAGVLISVSLVALPYVDSDTDFLGEAPGMKESKRSKLSQMDNELLHILDALGIELQNIPETYEGEHYGAKSKAWLASMRLPELFTNKTVFDQCWRRLKRNGKIKYENEDLQ